MTSTHAGPDTEPSPKGVAVGRPRPATWPGRRAARPAGAYDPDPLARDGPQGVEVAFTGEDGRTGVFSFATLPLPGWHADLAAAFARLTGPTGGVRTLAGAKGAWGALGRLLRFLASLPCPPRDPSRLTARQLRRFELHRRRTCTPSSVVIELGTLRGLLGQITPRGLLRADVVDWLGQRRGVEQQLGTRGYSEQEFGRIMAAARGDVAAIRDRIGATERLLAAAGADPQALAAADRAAAARLGEIARTGRVPLLRVAGNVLPDHVAMLTLARQLFLSDVDLAPLLVLGVGLSGRNGETLKELPATHELLEGRAVAVELVKRRRGPNNLHEVVHWEVGAPSRQLHTPAATTCWSTSSPAAGACSAAPGRCGRSGTCRAATSPRSPRRWTGRSTSAGGPASTGCSQTTAGRWRST